MIDSLSRQFSLHPQLIVLHIGKISVQHSHYEDYGSYEHGKSHQTDGAKNFLCHIFASILYPTPLTVSI